MPLRVPSTHPSYLLAWKGHWGRCLGPALEHTALCHFFSGNFQVKMSLLSPQLSISLVFLLAHPLECEVHVGDLPTPQSW